MRILPLLIAIGVLAITAGIPSQTSAAETAKSRMVDRTVECPTGNQPIREIDLNGQSGVRERGDRSVWQYRPYASFVAGGTSIIRRNNTVSASIVAGFGLSMSARCQPSKARVSLSTAGLSGVVASQFGDEYDCVVPSKILVRVRAVFRSPVSLRRVRDRQGGGTYDDELVASGPLREATLAIRIPSGKPIALATVHGAGRVRLFVGDTCGPNG